ncbi:hypothetical protein [Aquimarina intermedia]|uniref:Uncharacterized protein n=1 Tax=Aquimarina intermedia TaxID=350814 RepID=A0A5S5BWF0_9FLAO|nr:hypothetical protein [Aquimarina intermedia]TYP71505.1 hypothetical protein BD809_10987 [Aquimarina intermedia]
MKIETKLNIGDKCHFMSLDKPRESKVKEIVINVEKGCVSTVYVIDKNPSGSHNCTRFYDSEIFATKEELIKSVFSTNKN